MLFEICIFLVIDLGQNRTLPTMFIHFICLIRLIIIGIVRQNTLTTISLDFHFITIVTLVFDVGYGADETAFIINLNLREGHDFFFLTVGAKHEDRRSFNAFSITFLLRTNFLAIYILSIFLT